MLPSGSDEPLASNEHAPSVVSQLDVKRAVGGWLTAGTGDKNSDCSTSRRLRSRDR